jgi:uncharacterized protein YacL
MSKTIGWIIFSPFGLIIGLIVLAFLFSDEINYRLNSISFSEAYVWAGIFAYIALQCITTALDSIRKSIDNLTKAIEKKQ